MNSPERMLAILDLFDGRTMEWSGDAMAAHLGYSRSTLYRYLKALVEAACSLRFRDWLHARAACG